MERNEIPVDRTVECGYCKGTGEDPYGTSGITENCPDCNGNGHVIETVWVDLDEAAERQGEWGWH